MPAWVNEERRRKRMRIDYYYYYYFYLYTILLSGVACMGVNQRVTCPVMLMRFDASGRLWVALKPGEEGELELPAFKGQCRKGYLHLVSPFRGFLIFPIEEDVIRLEKDEHHNENGDDESDEEEEEEEEEEMLVVFDSKQAQGPIEPDAPSFVEGDFVWVAPSASSLLDDLLIEEAARNGLSGLESLDKTVFQSDLPPEARLKITRKSSPMAVKGLPSLGGTSSYLNTGLQILFRASVFREFAKEAQVAFPYLGEDSFTLRLAALFREMERPGDIRQGVGRAQLEALLVALQAHAPAMAQPEEAVAAIFEAIAAETNASPWVRRPLVLQLGQIKVSEADHCDCGQRDVSTPSTGYVLDLTVGREPVELENLLEESLKPRALIVEGHEGHENRRTLSIIDALPPVLIFRLQRSTEDGVQVRFPRYGLDMARFVGGYAGPPLLYDFVAASIPSDGRQPYTAGLLFPDCWYEIADDHHGNRFSFDFRHKAIGEQASLLVFRSRQSYGPEESVCPESFDKASLARPSRRYGLGPAPAGHPVQSREDTLGCLKHSGKVAEESFALPKLLVQGLPNLGATCYLNSALQLLFHSPLFRGFIMEAPRAFPDLSKDSITSQLASLFGEMEKKDVTRIGSDVMRKLVMSLQPHYQSVNLLGQNDPEEAITMIFDAVAAETKAANSLLTVTQLGQVRLVERDHCACGRRDRETPLLQYSFKLENLKAGQPNELEGLVEESLQPKPLEGVHGHEDHRNERQLSIQSLPPLLVLHVNRWTRGGGKNQAEVRFPETLDMTRHVRGYAGAPLVYRFAGASLHDGGISGGHYTTALVLPQCLYEISDDQYGNCYSLDDRRHSIGKNAVLLVYHLRPPPPGTD
jgi:hypothetical protein